MNHVCVCVSVRVRVQEWPWPPSGPPLRRGGAGCEEETLSWDTDDTKVSASPSGALVSGLCPRGKGPGLVGSQGPGQPSHVQAVVGKGQPRWLCRVLSPGVTNAHGKDELMATTSSGAVRIGVTVTVATRDHRRAPGSPRPQRAPCPHCSSSPGALCLPYGTPFRATQAGRHDRRPPGRAQRPASRCQARGGGRALDTCPHFLNPLFASLET